MPTVPALGGAQEGPRPSPRRPPSIPPDVSGCPRLVHGFDDLNSAAPSRSGCQIDHFTAVASGLLTGPGVTAPSFQRYQRWCARKPRRLPGVGRVTYRSQAEITGAYRTRLRACPRHFAPRGSGPDPTITHCRLCNPGRSVTTVGEANASPSNSHDRAEHRRATEFA